MSVCYPKAVFTIEGGGYAKCIGPSASGEPQVHRAIRFGAVLENVVVDPHDGGADVAYEGRTHRLRTGWRLGEVVLHGTWDDEPVTLQVERQGLRYRLRHWGTQADATVMTARAAELLALMPEKPPPDRSGLLLAPRPGLLTALHVEAGATVHAGEPLAVIEAMKMQNLLRADAAGRVAEVLARPGAVLAVDQPILRFAPAAEPGADGAA